MSFVPMPDAIARHIYVAQCAGQYKKRIGTRQALEDIAAKCTSQDEDNDEQEACCLN